MKVEALAEVEEIEVGKALPSLVQQTRRAGLALELVLVLKEMLELALELELEARLGWVPG